MSIDQSTRSAPRAKSKIPFAGAAASGMLFYRQFREQFHFTGAVLPSSRALAKELSRYVTQQRVPGKSLRILELGPGTGPVTAEICRVMQPGDTLDLVEVNDQFVQHLEHRFATEPDFQKVADRKLIFHGMVQQFSPAQPYDLIISGLPLNNFEVQDVRDILQLMGEWTKPGCRCSFFEYMGIRRLKKAFTRPSPSEKTRLQGVEAAIKEFLKNEEHKESVWMNIFPVWIHHLKKPL
ncbi:class I SAM-dependent methyltransferase [Planctomicrobium sp. SH664]|uniref:class I SAM-dependent methyltransferase n=1 Tax=Planctomicrobium sp. SH664 TaxID=3448125 RepID=UPI003F5BA109